MNAPVTLKVILVFGPVLALLVLGFAITLRSGVVHLASGQGLRRLAGNMSQTVIVLVACLVALVAIQEMVGYRLHLAW